MTRECKEAAELEGFICRAREFSRRVELHCLAARGIVSLRLGVVNARRRQLEALELEARWREAERGGVARALVESVPSPPEG
jgi:hypothetical protein